MKTRICPNPYCQMREPLKVAGTEYIGVEADHQKRAILDLVFPEWRENEEIKREEFYRSRGYIKKCEVDKGEDLPVQEPDEDKTTSDGEERVALKVGNKKQAVSADLRPPSSLLKTEPVNGNNSSTSSLLKTEPVNGNNSSTSSSSGGKVTDSRTIKALVDRGAERVCQIPQIEKPLLRIPCKSMMSKLSFHIAKKLFLSRNKDLDLSSEGTNHKNVKVVSDLIVLKYVESSDAHEDQKRVLEKTSTAGDSFPSGSFSSDISYLEVLYSCTTEEDANTVIKILSDLPQPTALDGEDVEEMRQ